VRMKNKIGRSEADLSSAAEMVEPEPLLVSIHLTYNYP
jgi:hypothetical protein